MSTLADLNPEIVIFAVVDSLRADAVRRAMQTVETLGERGVVATDCFCTGSGTPTGMTGLMQSRLPTDHGGQAAAHPLVPDVPTLAEEFKSRGFDTGGWHSNPYTSDEYDYDRGFDTFHDLTRREGAGNDTESSLRPGRVKRLEDAAKALGVDELAREAFLRLRRYGLVDYRPHAPAEDAVSEFLRWLDTDTEGSFGWFQLMDTHSPYLPPDSYLESESDCPTSRREIWRLNDLIRDAPQDLSDDEVSRLESLYLASARYVDDQIARLVDELKGASRWGDTLLIVTGDHGEMFGDHDIPDDIPLRHPNYLCESVTRVPLVFAGGAVESDRVTEPISGRDVPPTLVRTVGETPPESWDGRPLGEGGSEALSVTGRGVKQDHQPGQEIPSDTLHASLRTDDYAVLWWSNGVRPPEFLKRTESGERKVKRCAVPGSEHLAEHLEERFAEAAEGHVGHDDSTDDLEEGTAERLRELGYLE